MAQPSTRVKFLDLALACQIPVRLNLREVSDGKSSEPVAFALEQLAEVLRATKRVKEAAVLEKRAANIRKVLQ